MPTSYYTISAAPPLFPKPTKNFATGQSWVYMGLYQPDCVARHMFMMGFFFVVVPWEHLSKIWLPSLVWKSHRGCC